MAKAVFIQSSHSRYNDAPGERYHFPNRPYLGRVAQTVGDWVIFYSSRAGEFWGYYSVQQVEKIVSDPTDSEMSYAILDRGTLLGFETLVPRLRTDGRPWETGLPDSGGSKASAVRLISDADFAAIVNEGMRPLPGPNALPRGDFALAEAAAEFVPLLEQERPAILTSRALRDRAFSRQVRRAYGGRCAISGLEIRNGGGRPEVEAAHIVPVEERGPDAVTNGLALSGTLHWMFDRGLISVDADDGILIARGSIADESARRLIRPEGRLILPERPQDRPHSAYLRWHREHRFKG
jgi:putative restriction endonuclease